MRLFAKISMLVSIVLLTACQSPEATTSPTSAREAPFPATWTPTFAVAGTATATATLVVQPTPTWDGTPPPPSEALVPRMSAAGLDRALHAQGETVVIDGRSLAAYRQLHISGTLHIPFDELINRSSELDTDALIVLYTSVQDQEESLEAAMGLYELGFSRVAILEGGIQAWYSGGYPTMGTGLVLTPDELGPPTTLTPLVTTPGAVTGTVTATVVLESSTTPTATLAAAE